MQYKTRLVENESLDGDDIANANASYSRSKRSHKTFASRSLRKIPPSRRYNSRLSRGAIGCVTITLGTTSASASTVGFSFSSMFTIKCVGASRRIFSKFTSLVPPTFGIADTADCGCMQKPVRPTTRLAKPKSHKSSVIEGTSDTIRTALPGSTGGCFLPSASTSSDIGMGMIFERCFMRSLGHHAVIQPIRQ